jgi:hypothetical protein
MSFDTIYYYKYDSVNDNSPYLGYIRIKDYDSVEIMSKESNVLFIYYFIIYS